MEKTSCRPEGKGRNLWLLLNSAPVLLSSGSTLASLFGVSKAMDGGGNPNFSYQPPKQPKKQAKGISLSHFASLPTTVHLREGGTAAGGAAPEAHQLLVATAVDAQKQ